VTEFLIIALVMWLVWGGSKDHGKKSAPKVDKVRRKR